MNRIIYTKRHEFLSLGVDESSSYRMIRRGRVIDMGPSDAIWAPLSGFPGYEVSRCGLVRNSISSQGAHLGVMKASNHHGGYVRYGIILNGKVVSILAHRAVATTFLDNPRNLKVINHTNAVKDDNRVENLEWCTELENVLHARDMGLLADNRGVKNPAHVLTEEQVLKISESKMNGPTLASIYGVTKETINKIKRKEAWVHLFKGKNANTP